MLEYSVVPVDSVDLSLCHAVRLQNVRHLAEQLRALLPDESSLYSARCNAISDITLHSSFGVVLCKQFFFHFELSQILGHYSKF